MEFCHIIHFPDVDGEPHRTGKRTAGDEYGEIDGSITSKSIISWISVSMTSRVLNGMG